MADAAAILADSHGRALRMICSATGIDFQGLGHASRVLKHLDSGLRRRLLHLDIATHMNRHATVPRVTKFLQKLETAMANKAVNNEIIDAPECVSDSGTTSDTATPTPSLSSGCSSTFSGTAMVRDLLREQETSFFKLDDASDFCNVASQTNDGTLLADLDERAAWGLSRLQELRLQLLADPEDGDVSEASCVEDCHNLPEPFTALASLVENVVGHLYSLARASAMVDRMFFHERVSSGQPDVQQIFEGFVIGNGSDDDDDDCDAPICSVLDDMQCLKFIT